MINVCKITTKSQTICILPSVPAHFLQLLRDGAGGSLLKTTRPNFKHFLPTLHTCLVLSIPVSLPWSEEMPRSRAGDRSSQTPPHSSRSGVRAAFSASASLEEPIRRSSMTMTSLLRETETFFFIFIFSILRVLVRGARGAPLTRLRRNFERGRTRSATRSAQTNRTEEEDVFWWMGKKDH